MDKGKIARYEQFLLFQQCGRLVSQGRQKVLCGNGLICRLQMLWILSGPKNCRLLKGLIWQNFRTVKIESISGQQMNTDSKDEICFEKKEKILEKRRKFC